MIDERLEIPITEKKRNTVLDASRRDEGVDRFANRYLSSSRKAIIARSLDSNVPPPPDFDELKRTEHAQCLVEIGIVDEGLQDFGQRSNTAADARAWMGEPAGSTRITPAA